MSYELFSFKNMALLAASALIAYAIHAYSAVHRYSYLFLGKYNNELVRVDNWNEERVWRLVVVDGKCRWCYGDAYYSKEGKDDSGE